LRLHFFSEIYSVYFSFLASILFKRYSSLF